MRLRPYEKIAGGGGRVEVDLGGPWVALEKIHGAQLVVAVAGDEVRFAKRKAWLADDDPFFGWQLVRAELAEAARRVAAALDAPEVVLYGELFGGGYPHPDVEPVAGLQPVQTGVWYAPDLRWAAFDVLVAEDDDDPGERLAWSELREVRAGAGLLLPPQIRAGRRADVEGASERFATAVPGLLGLPSIEGNLAEGLVVRRDRRAGPSETVSYKRKIVEFDEGRFGEAEAWDAEQRPDLDALCAWARRLTNPARVASAASKWGRDDPKAVLDEVELDVLIDLAEAFPAVAASPSDDDEATLRAVVRAAASEVL